MGGIGYSNEYSCLTQDSLLPTFGVAPASHLHDGHQNTPTIVLGVGPIVPRWDVSKSNTKLLYFVRTETFPSADVAKYASQMLQQAAGEWNSLGLGVVISQAVTQASANFNLVYQINGPNEEGVLARAFFPNELDQDVIVFEYGLNVNNKGILKNVFMHELGHVLGLRHEFAIAEEGEGAVQFMKTNPVSVMSYTFPPNIQQSDKDGIQAFYKLKNGEKIDGSPVTDYLPQLRRMK